MSPHKTIATALSSTLIFLIASVGINQNVYAADAPEFNFGEEPSAYYLGLDVMAGNGAVWTANSTPPVTTQVSTQKPLKLTFGRKFTPYFGLEVSYAENDAQKDYGPGSTFFGNDITKSNIVIRQKTRFLPINTVWRYAVTSDVDAIFKAGVVAMKNNFSFSHSSDSGAAQSDSNTTIKPTIGLASEIRINSSFSAIFGADYIPSYSYSYIDKKLEAQLSYQLKNSHLYVGTRFSF